MFQLLVLSGKGGTGKTTVASGLIALSKAKGFADCDVDAPNLHLLNSFGTQAQTKGFYGLPKAQIDLSKCVMCDKCRENCKFNAIKSQDGKGYFVDKFACEGCGVCQLVCPAGAMELKPAIAGELKLFDQNDTVFSTAQLKMGSGNSGKLVTEVKKQLKTDKDIPLAIIDGSPGIGCPVIASLSGVDLVLLVAEPSVSSISDMERILNTASVFGTKAVVCVNKFDVNLENTSKIEKFCLDNGIDFVGKIPFDPMAQLAINQGKTIVELDCPSAKALGEIYDKLMHLCNLS